MTLSDEIKALVSTLEMQLNGFAKAAYEKDLRIADLERQLAEASAPAVEQQPVAVIQQINEVNRTAVVAVTASNRWDIDVAIGDRLYAAPQAADTDKVREALASIGAARIDAVWEAMPGGLNGFLKQFGYQQFAYAILDLAADVIEIEARKFASMAAQAPVREVPEGREIFGWIIVNEDTREHDGGEVYTDKYEADHYMENRCLPGWQLEPIYRALPAAPVQQEGA